MALTKARPPVTAISQMINGTTDINVAAAGGPIDINVAGVDVIDISSTQVTLDALIQMVSSKILGELVDLQTTAGAQAVAKTDATQMQVGTTSTHPVDLIANAITALTLQTTGKVALGVEGTAVGDIMTKAYIDAGDAASGNTSVAATTGSIIVAASPSDIIFKWGVQTGTGDRTITFGTAFPNAIFIALATGQNTGTASSDGMQGVENLATTGFDWNTANKTGYAGNVNWVAIGF